MVALGCYTAARASGGRVWHLERHVARLVRGAQGLGVEQDYDAVLAQDVGDRFGYVRVFAAHQLSAPFYDGDLAAETPEHLGELQPDVAAAEHEQERLARALLLVIKADVSCLNFTHQLLAVSY